MRVLGIDTGIAIVGWSIVDKTGSSSSLINCGAIFTDKDQKNEDRLKKIFKAVTQIIEKYSPDCIAIESLFFFKNKKTVMQVSQSRGVILLAGSIAEIDIFDYTPLQVKTAVTGYGRADKDQVQKMVKLIFKLEEIPKPDDIADSIAIAVCHINSN